MEIKDREARFNSINPEILKSFLGKFCAFSVPNWFHNGTFRKYGYFLSIDGLWIRVSNIKGQEELINIQTLLGIEEVEPKGRDKTNRGAEE
jgi:hypothetical protein